jgi:two-component system chemotaxis response regulator CheY
VTVQTPSVLVVAADPAAAAGLGYHVTIAAGAEDAVAAIAATQPDAILLGDAALELLDRLPADAVPMIVLAQGREALPDALRRGARDCIVAPFDPAELDARLAAALRVKALHDALVDANRRLAAQALTDELTGLANRRDGELRLERQVALCVRGGQDLGLIRIDVDHFKDINDTRGHQAGDRVLAEVAHRLADAVRAGDELARWGGDEFVVLLPNTDRAGIVRAAERLRMAVAEAPIALEGDDAAVTISIGWAHWAGDTASDLLLRADRALYAAKDAGRDTIHPRT